MLMKSLATLAAAAVFGAVGLVATAPSAEARPHIFFEHHHFGRHFGGPFFGGGIFLGPPIDYDYSYNYPVGACRGLLARAERTGSPYWYRRWHQCRLEVYGVY
jgi:hypothetical protein